MCGEEPIDNLVSQQFIKYNKLYGLNAERWNLDTTTFCVPSEQRKLF